MPALLFGSISTVADTSELQREAFNQAFAEHGLDWNWDQAQYRELLSSNGGQGRIADWAREHGQEVDAKAVHETKSRIFHQSLAARDVTARDGVLDAIRDAKEGGWKVGLVTTTSPENVAALLTALSPDLSADDFDVIVDSTDVDEAKPSGAAYRHALGELDVEAGSSVALEDNVGGVRAAADAGVPVAAFPNVNTAGHDFGTAQVVDHVELAELQRLVHGD